MVRTNSIHTLDNETCQSKNHFKPLASTNNNPRSTSMRASSKFNHNGLLRRSNHSKTADGDAPHNNSECKNRPTCTMARHIVDRSVRRVAKFESLDIGELPAERMRFD